MKSNNLAPVQPFWSVSNFMAMFWSSLAIFAGAFVSAWIPYVCVLLVPLFAYWCGRGIAYVELSKFSMLILVVVFFTAFFLAFEIFPKDEWGSSVVLAVFPALFLLWGFIRELQGQAQYRTVLGFR